MNDRLVSREREGEGADEQGTRMPKRRRSERDGARTLERRRQQHLYLVFDDWHSGYSIREVNLPSSGSGDGAGAEQPLPQAFLRILIVVIYPGVHQIAPIIDVRERSVAFGPGPNFPACPFFILVGDDKLLAMDVNSFDICLDLKPSDLSWEKLPIQPFNRLHVSSYAVQPDGPIHLVSTKNGATAATFAFDVKECAWKLHGEWALPFTGCGHYEPSLEAFVGISKDPETLGYLYSCPATSTGTGDTGDRRLCPSPKMKRSKENVYSKNPAERHVSATLVYMRRGKYCLVECVSIDDDGADQELPQRSRSYSLPHEATNYILLEDPVAFWL
uniref:DUF1618 domain-containing protein n=1 Tax=Setaria italica TaxID=4555 RepID=K4AJE8_SETIT